MGDLLAEFAAPVFATNVTVRETFGNGFVTQIDLLDVNNVLHTVWTGVDSSPGQGFSGVLCMKLGLVSLWQ